MTESEKCRRKMQLLKEVAAEVVVLSYLEIFVSKYIIGDPIADLYEDIAAEEKARATYQWLIDMTDDVDLQDGLTFLREREVVHSIRFREAVEILKEDQATKKIF